MLLTIYDTYPSQVSCRYLCLHSNFVYLFKKNFSKILIAIIIPIRFFLIRMDYCN